jgi:hypothetical protein
MPRYTIKLNVAFFGKDTLVLDLPNDFTVGQTVSITPNQSMQITDPSRGSVALTPGVTVTGTVTAKQ